MIKGDGRGSSLGFPTANLENTEDLCLKEGKREGMVGKEEKEGYSQ